MNKRIDFHTHHLRTTEIDDSFYCHGNTNFLIPKRQYFCLGIHPWFLLHKNQLKELENLLHSQINNPFFVGIGEIGLDKKRGSPMDEQLFFFEEQVKMACKYSISFLVIHIVKAYQEVYSVLIKYEFQGTILLHDFHGNQQTLEQFQKKFNVHISYNIHSFKRSNTLKIIQNSNSTIVLPESDENDPQSIDKVNEKLCNLLRLDLEDLKKNQAQVFKSLTKRANSFPIE